MLSNIAMGDDTMGNTTDTLLNHATRGDTVDEGYARLCRLALQVVPLALKLLFAQFHSQGRLAETLSKMETRTILQRLHVDGSISDKQWKLLYPCDRNGKVDVEQYDADLLITLLKSICHLPVPYPSGWQSMPPTEDISTSADLVRVQLFPQRLAKTMSYDMNTWDQISSILTRLGGPQCQTMIDEIATSVISSEERQSYVSSLQSLVGASHKSTSKYSSTRASVTGRRRTSEQHYISKTTPDISRSADLKTERVSDLCCCCFSCFTLPGTRPVTHQYYSLYGYGYYSLPSCLKCLSTFFFICLLFVSLPTILPF